MIIKIGVNSEGVSLVNIREKEVSRVITNIGVNS